MRHLFAMAVASVLLALAARPASAQLGTIPSPLSSPENATPAAPPPPPVAPDASDLDHVVAVIGTNVLLQSDVDQEMRFAALEPLQVLPGRNTPEHALRRLIDRTLILQQMKEQQQAVTTAAPEVSRGLEALRTEIPACSRYHCENQQGWNDFLQAHQLSQTEVNEHWSQRMAILRFIDLRFRGGIRVTDQQIADYYNKILVPALRQHHESAPPLAQVSGRIREILLQQQVSGLFRDWLSSLRDQGNVQVVDSAYADELNSNGASAEKDDSQ